MLNKILTSLALTVGLTIQPSIASEAKKVPVDLICVNLETLDELLTEFGEEAALTMMVNRESKTGISSNPMVFFMNPKTKSWTLVEKISEKYYCVVALGENVKPYFEEKSKNSKGM